MIAEPLGTLTKSASIPSPTQEKTGVGDGYWNRFQLAEGIEAVLPGHRVCQCGQKAVPGKMPAIFQPAEGNPFIGNVRACGSVWLCPYCCAKVSRKRSEELREGVVAAQAQGLEVTFVTFTVSHSRADKLGPLLAAFSRAMRRFYSGRGFQSFKAFHGYEGAVRNLEVTWGEGSGWHPHAHALMFSRSALDAAMMKQRWMDAALHEGLTADWEHGLTATDADTEIYGYLTKMGKPSWAAPEELTMAHYKRSSGERFGPFDLVREFMSTGDLTMSGKFREYAKAFKGKRQLYWSKGLRAKLGLGVEVSDEDAANEHEEVAQVLHAFSPHEWRSVVRGRWQLVLLDTLMQGGYDEFYALLLEVCGYSDTWFDPQIWVTAEEDGEFL